MNQEIDLVAIASESGLEEAVRRALLDEPLVAMGHAASLLWLQFGALRTIPARLGGTREVGAHALHTEAQWELAGPNGVIVQRKDLFTNLDGTLVNDVRLVKKHMLFDDRIGQLRSKLDSGGLIVRSVSVDRTGGLRLSFVDEFVFEIVTAEHAEEQWRIFAPGKDAPHLIV